MVIGILQFEIIVRGAESLKDKRRVLRSLKDRLHREHLVAVAEVGAQEALNMSVLAVASLGTDGARVGEVLDRIDAKVRAGLGYEVGDVSRQIIRGADAQWPEADADEQRRAIDAEMLARMNEPPREPRS